MSKPYALFFATNRRFLFALGVCLLSLKKNSPRLCQQADILVYHQGLTPKDQQFLNRILPCQFTTYHFAVETNFEHINFKNFTQLAFARYEIFDLLDRYQKILYLDVDIMIGGELEPLVKNFGNRSGLAMCRDQQKGLSLITKNFIQPVDGYDMTLPCYNSGVMLFSNALKNRSGLRMWCYERTAEMLENLVCPDQGVLNLMLQAFHIQVEELPDIYNCLPSNTKFLDKKDCGVLVYHCAGGGLRFWSYTWNGPWQQFYAQYLSIGGPAHTETEHKWLAFIKKHRLERFRFFDRCPNPLVHSWRFVKYCFKQIF
ncbi:MAG: glycosyltransferase family 8 protein [Elusimicrobiaceae bacterium]|nr:glycosyltransferase family 8 protein [Elusimicrobiaceae bacterium]